MPHILKIALIALLCGGLFSASSASAENKNGQKYIYEPPSLERMFDFMFANGTINPEIPAHLNDYVHVKDCALYKQHFQDDFAWDRIRSRVIEDSKTLQDDMSNRFVLPVRFTITRYNFRTKAFDIDEDSILRNVNIMTLVANAYDNVCSADGQTIRLQAMPTTYKLRLDVPLSLYRIPMAENMGRKILDEMEPDDRDKQNVRRFLYGLVYVTADSVHSMEYGTATFLGRVDRLEFFLDAKRSQRIRTLYYSDL